MPRTQVTGKKLYQTQAPLTTKGGVPRYIDDAVGDIARTTSGWIEDEKFGWYAAQTATAWSAEFDSAVTRTGRLTLKLSATDATGRFIVRTLPTTGGSTLERASKYGFAIKPLTEYRFRCYVKTENVATNSVSIRASVINSNGTTATAYDSSALSGTNDWSLLERTFTTGASDAWFEPQVRLSVAGNISDAWFDVNSMTLEEVTTINNTSGSPAYLYPKGIAVTSTDNIDQSQVVSFSTARLGEVGSAKLAQQFTPTKKNLTGFVIRRGTETGTYTGDVTISIQADSGSTTPSGTDLGTPITLTNAQWLAVTSDTDYTVNYPLTLTIGGTYWIVTSSSTQDNSNYSRIRVSDTTNPYSGGTAKAFNSSTLVWGSTANYDLYFKTLYSKNTTNFTVRTDTQEVSVTAPTPDGWEDGTIIDTADGTYGVEPLALADGVNNIYVSSNSGTTADGTVDPSLQATITPQIYTAFERALATNRGTASNRVKVRDMGTALRFPDTEVSTHAISLTNAITFTGEFTQCFYVKLNYPINIARALTGHTTQTSKVVLANGKLFFRVVNAGSGDNNVVIPKINEYFHLTLRRDSDNKVDLFIDGQNKTRLFGNAAQVGNYVINRIGRADTNNSQRAQHDDHRYFDRALTDQEIYDLRFNNIVPRNDLVLEYLFDEASGPTALDTSGNGNNGTITGATFTTDVPLIPRTQVS
jgi:hypothetical protein